jgi:hypothetical protein
VSREDFRRDINRTFDNISGPPSPALSARVRSALIEKGPAPTGPIWMAGVAAALIAAIVVGVLVVTNFNRHQTSFVPGGLTTASPSPNPSASPSVLPTQTPDATVPATITWGCVNSTLPPPVSAPATANVRAIRTGTHAGYDRITIEFSNGLPAGIDVQVQSGSTFTQGASGQKVTLAGSAGIVVIIHGADGHTAYTGATDMKTNYAALKEVRQLEDFEGVVQWGLGTTTTCYRAFELTNPARLVIDIQAS